MTYDIVQWTTGNVGRRSVRAILANPDLHLVGCYAWSADKVGRDVADLCGLDEPTGVHATDDIDALLALRPDCVSYNPVWPDVGHLVRILSAGINVASTSAFITGHWMGEADHQRIVDACAAGGSSIFGSGMNPGYANLLALVSAGICERIDSVSVLESVDSTGYGSADTERSVGYGQPAGSPELPAMIATGTAVFGDAVRLMADALHVELDEVVCESETAITTEQVVDGDLVIEPGCVAGVSAHWLGKVGGTTVIDLGVRWRKGRTLEPDWKVEHGYLVDVQGLPCVRTKLQIFPPRDFKASSMADYMQLGMIMTALPAINAIPAICAASPGIHTYADLPLITGAGFVTHPTP
jgi:hypothetical protein